MAKFEFSPSIKISDIFAIKHALQLAIDKKNQRLQEICSSNNWNDGLEIEYKRLLKDIKREKELIKYCTDNIKKYLISKENLKHEYN